ncbi:MAG: hypothetical protein ACE5GJ_08230 [Gemmatimonadota bacterium]
MTDREDPPPPHLPTRRFTPEEVRRILERAARSESAALLPGPYDPDLSTLMHAAEEAGLDPAAVRRAAALRSGPGAALLPPRVGSLVPGAPLQWEVQAKLEEARLPTDPAPVVEALEGALGRRGTEVEAGPGNLLWKEDHVLGRTTIALSQDDGALSLRMTADLAGHFLAGWVGGLTGWAVLAALTPLGALGPFWAVLAFVVVPFLLVRPWWTRHSASARNRLEHAAMRMLEACEAEDGGG